MFRTKNYNIEVTIECKTCEDAANVAAFILFSGFYSTVDGTRISIIAKNVTSTSLDYLATAIEEDDRVVSSSFHKTLF